MKKHIVLVLIVILMASGIAIATDINKKQSDTQQPIESQRQAGKTGEIGIATPSTTIPGHMFTGDYIRVGINNGGTLGITGSTGITNPGVGLQSTYDTPFSSTGSTESLATGIWLEGYNVAYNVGNVNKKIYWYPELGYPIPSALNITVVSNSVLVNDNNRAIKKTVIKTKDGNLRINFTWTFYKAYPEISLETLITNTGRSTVRNIMYKRLADFDVCTTYSDDSWVSTADAAFASGSCGWMGTVQLTASGRDGVGAPVSYVNLNELWNAPYPSPGTPKQSIVPITFDGSAGIYYKIGNLDPGKSKTVYTVYQTNFPLYVILY